MKNEKYKLTKETIDWCGETLHRIEALKDFGKVSKGDKGGFIKAEANLSVSGNARVYGNASVYGDAWVSGNAWVYGDASVSGDARVSGKFSLTAGHFFGMKYNNEEIKTFKTADSEEILYKGDGAKIEPTGPETPSLKGKEVEVKLDGKTYKAIIQ